MKVVAGRTLDAIKAELLADVDRQAEAVRLRYITAGSGQALTYQQKAAEAAAFAAEPAIDPELVPHIMAEVGITAETPEEVAAIILGRRADLQLLSATIEHFRLAAKQAIAAAESLADAAYYAKVDWSLIG